MIAARNLPQMTAGRNVIALGLVVLLAASCAGLLGPVAISHAAGWSGWFTARIDAGETGAPDTKSRYLGRFADLPLGLSTPPCDEVRARVQYPGRPFVVAVHGVEGDGPEWWPAMPVLAAARPAALLMFRWVPYDERDPITLGLAVGVSRLLECAGDLASGLVVLAHSAGGIVASYAASRIAVPASWGDKPVVIVTVASPLAGTVDRARNTDGRAEAKFILDLGSAISSYPAAARGVTAVHLRTQYPADGVMKPTAGGHRPNEPGIGVPGARELEVPADVGHVPALAWAAEELASGRL